VRVDQIDGYNFSLDKIIVEVNHLPILCGQFDIRKIICSPAGAVQSTGAPRGDKAGESDGGGNYCLSSVFEKVRHKPYLYEQRQGGDL
jgi:hypothetical protein